MLYSQLAYYEQVYTDLTVTPRRCFYRTYGNVKTFHVGDFSETTCTAGTKYTHTIPTGYVPSTDKRFVTTAIITDAAYIPKKTVRFFVELNKNGTATVIPDTSVNASTDGYSFGSPVIYDTV